MLSSDTLKGSSTTLAGTRKEVTKRWNQLRGRRTVIAAGVVVAGPMGAYVGGAGAAILGQAAGEKFEEIVGRTQ